MENTDMFNDSTFEETMRDYVNQIGWNLLQNKNRIVVLSTTGNSGRLQVLLIKRFDDRLEFSVESSLKFGTEFSSVNHAISSVLLENNAKYKIGFWCLRPSVTNEKYCFVLLHNAQLELINLKYFQKTAEHLVATCDEFEQDILEALRK